MKEEGVFQGWVGAFGKGGLGSGGSRCQWYGDFSLKMSGVGHEGHGGGLV